MNKVACEETGFEVHIPDGIIEGELISKYIFNNGDGVHTVHIQNFNSDLAVGLAWEGGSRWLSTKNLEVGDTFFYDDGIDDDFKRDIDPMWDQIVKQLIELCKQMKDSAQHGRVHTRNADKSFFTGDWQYIMPEELDVDHLTVFEKYSLCNVKLGNLMLVGYMRMHKVGDSPEEIIGNEWVIVTIAAVPKKVVLTRITMSTVSNDDGTTSYIEDIEKRCNFVDDTLEIDSRGFNDTIADETVEYINDQALEYFFAANGGAIVR